jgi:protein-disulfide isomerase
MASATKRARARSKRQRRKSHQTRTFFVIIGVLVVAVLGAFVLTATGSGAADVDETRLGLDPSLGPESAPVVITEYGDFGCPSCRVWHNADIREQIIATYGGDVRFVFKDFPVITAQSPKAAEAGQCALDQGLFWEYHDLVYENFQGLSDSNLRAYAAQVGLNADEFGACLDSGTHRATVNNDWDEARQLGLRGTPTFLVNGQQLVGVPYYETFVGQIDAVLANL